MDDILVENALEILPVGAKAIALYTDGKFLEIKPNGEATSGHWNIAPREDTTHVILYKKSNVGTVNEVYVGRYLGAVASSHIPGRFVLQISSLSFKGKCYKNWTQFSPGSRNGVHWIEK